SRAGRAGRRACGGRHRGRPRGPPHPTQRLTAGCGPPGYPLRRGEARLPGMRGDKVEGLVDTGNGGGGGFEIGATRWGRRVEVTTSRTMVEVAEVTRTGQPVRTARFLSSRVVAIVEHPYDDGRAQEAGPPGWAPPPAGAAPR